MKSNWIAAGAVALAIGSAAVAYAQTIAPADAVRARIDRFREMGTAFKTINDQLKRDTPLKVMLTSSGSTILTSAREVQPMFPQGSGASAGVKTKAKAEIWARRKEFDAKLAKLLTEANKMNIATRSGNLDSMRAQVKTLGAVCKDCHTSFRDE